MKPRSAIVFAALGLLMVRYLAGGVLAESAPKDVVESADHQKYSATAYKEGHSDAVKDVREDRLIIERHGLPPPWTGEYAKALLEKYHIQLKTVAGCVVDEKIVGRARGYNEVSTAEIERRFGHGVLESTASEVQKRWQKEHSR